MIKGNYCIKKIDSKTANGIVFKNHYLHRNAQAQYCFGLFEINPIEPNFFDSDLLIGVIIFGMPASPNVCRGICGNDHFSDVIELTRLWIKDNTPKNVESFLIGNAIKLIPKKIIISYSEPSFGHRGVVYQATNFIYTGLTEKRTNRVPINGSTQKHNRHECMNKENTKLVDRPRKHRYIYFNCSKTEKKHFIKKLKYTIKQYPKNP